MFEKKRVKCVGFDLDETLYESNPRINDRIRDAMAKEILTLHPKLLNLSNARRYFERRYKELNSGRKVLIESGFSKEEASYIVDKCVSQAEILDLISPDENTVELIRKISEKYTAYLITSSTQEIAKRKLNAIGIEERLFKIGLFGDTNGFGSKQDGDHFKLALTLSNNPPENHVYVGNSRKSDILPAKNLGMQTIAVWSEIEEADLSIPHIHKLGEILL
jgi:FMN phosphatase YigB (HAD superfamily)